MTTSNCQANTHCDIPRFLWEMLQSLPRDQFEAVVESTRKDVEHNDYCEYSLGFHDQSHGYAVIQKAFEAVPSNYKDRLLGMIADGATSNR